jgi:coenzyme F420-dependent glucose-6-phosphate dehydrogenase
MEIGYWLSSEEHSPRRLVEHAQRAEDAGFSYVLLSDHFHPWVDAQGHSPFVWSVIGAVAQATERLRLGTAVTCPLIRMHPAIVAQAAATSALLMEGRFFLGVGSGELLNEHILGDRWPRPDERLEMLAEAIELIRTLWKGDYETFRGKHYTVEQARLYDVPERPPELIVAAAAEHAAQLAAKWGDGMISTSPDGALIDGYRRAGGTAPIYGKVTGCFAATAEEAKRVAKKRSPNSAIGGSVSQELALPRDFEAVAELVREGDLEGAMSLGRDPAAWQDGIDTFERLGFTHLCLHDVSEDQRAFIEFAKQFIEHER